MGGFSFGGAFLGLYNFLKGLAASPPTPGDDVTFEPVYFSRSVTSDGVGFRRTVSVEDAGFRRDVTSADAER